MNRRGNASLESIMLIIVIFLVAIMGIVAAKIGGELNDQLQEETETFSPETLAISDDLTTRNPIVFDYLSLTVLIVFWLAGLYASFKIQSVPAFYVLALLLLTIVLIMGGIFSNAFTDFTTGNEFEDTLSDFPLTTFIMGNLFVIIMVMGFSFLIMFHGKEGFS